MKKRHLRFAALAVVAATLSTLTACGGTGGSSGDADSVTLYSADGLADWYGTQFEAFEDQTGIKVDYVEGGSGEVVSRAAKEKSNPQVDVVVTLPPFIQQADKQGLLDTTRIADDGAVPAADKAPNGHYVTLANNYFTMIRGTAVTPKAQSWDDLLDPRFKQKVQYSTPGQAGDGTALLLLLRHVMGEKDALEYLGRLQANNVGPSASTGKLGPKVSKGELAVANSDVQMALASISGDSAAFETFVPAGADGSKTTVALPYVMGKASNAPHAENAQRLIDFLMSKAVQSTLADGALGVSPRTDVEATGANAERIAKAVDGVEIWQPDWTEVNDDFDALIDSYNKATDQ